MWFFSKMLLWSCHWFLLLYKDIREKKKLSIFIVGFKPQIVGYSTWSHVTHIHRPNLISPFKSGDLGNAVLVSSKGRVTKFGRKTRWRTKTRQLRLLSCKTHRYIAMTLTGTWENGRYYWKKWYIIIIRWIWGSQSFAMSVHRRKFVETMQKCSHL